jgi:glycosyltransferase involved in cell wall biosynthesis
MSTPKVIIIMSTYNGNRFIKQQLESLLNQTYPSEIIIRDDGSSDNTRNILNDFANDHHNIHLYKDNTTHKGLRDSYFILLNEAISYSPDYICYADQDDVWLSDKTEKLLKKIISAETSHQPSLVFSDVEVVDESLNTIHVSLEKLQHLDNHQTITLKKLLFYCPALGCTIMLNKPLFELIASIPEHGKSINPDKWALILASITGKIICLPEATVKYRQHSSNTVGAMLGIKRKTWSIKNINFIKNRYQTALDQAQDILDIPFLPTEKKNMLLQFTKMFTENHFKRLRHYFTFISSPPHWKRKCGLAMSLFLNYNLKGSHAKEYN